MTVVEPCGGVVTCARCDLYDYARGPRIRAEIAKTSTGAEADRRYADFLADYHHLHTMAGRTAALMALIYDETEAP